jgi:rhodanese-related sulfurtransferase
MNGILQIQPGELKQHLDAGREFVFLDVREPWEVDIAGLANTVNVPLGQLDAVPGRLDPEAEIVVICHHGIRSQRACQYLFAQGFKHLYNLSGGIDAWAACVDPGMARY